MATRTEHSSLRQGLVGAWCPSLGASGLTLIDRSGRNAHGTPTNMAGQNNWQASGSGVALKCDGVDDYVAIRPPAITVSSLSLTGWANYITAPNLFAGLVYVRQPGIVAGIFPGGGNVITSMWNATIQEYNASTGLSVPSVGRWFFFAMIVDGPLLTTLVNNSSYSLAITSTARNIGVEWNIGRDPQGDRLSNALFDDIRIYNRALTLAEIRLLASRRGIGLTPLPDRAAGLPRRFSVNVGGTWREADSYVNVGGDWRLGQPSVNVGGTWR